MCRSAIEDVDVVDLLIELGCDVKIRDHVSIDVMCIHILHDLSDD